MSTPPPREDGYPTNPGGDCCQVMHHFRGHHCRPNTYRRRLCRIHGRSVACCKLPKALGYTLTCIDADGVLHMTQISTIHKALHPFIGCLPTPTAEQNRVKLPLTVRLAAAVLCNMILMRFFLELAGDPPPLGGWGGGLKCGPDRPLVCRRSFNTHSPDSALRKQAVGDWSSSRGKGGVFFCSGLGQKGFSSRQQ